MISEAKHELKRADHLIFVSLKYTRTIDVLASIIQRLINSCDFAIDALIEFSNKRKKDKTVSKIYKVKAEFIKGKFKKNEMIIEFIEFSDFLRRILKAEHLKREEFRKNVTLTAMEGDVEVMQVNMDVIKDYYRRTCEYIDEISNMVLGVKSDD